MACGSILQYSAVAFVGVAILSSSAMAEDSAKILAGYEKTGESLSCLNLRQVRDTDPLDDYGIIFEVAGKKTYLNELNSRCARLGREKRFSYKTSINRICRGEIITVFDSFGNVAGSCSLGDFQELSKLDEGDDTAS